MDHDHQRRSLRIRRDAARGHRIRLTLRAPNPAGSHRRDRLRDCSHLGSSRRTAGSGTPIEESADRKSDCPRTDSHDLYHRIMLILIAAALAFLFTPSARAAPSR
jgi:hypothetical protein